MEAFNLERALSGDKIVTRSGLNIISLEIDVSRKDSFDIKAMDDRNIVKFYNRKGFWKINQLSAYDLFMKEEESIPVYTQETAELQGNLYQIGALYIGYNNALVKLNEIRGDDFIGTDVSGNDYRDNWLISIEDSEFSGLEIGTVSKAPIELIDGKAYQFDYQVKTELEGVYNKREDKFILSESSIYKVYCTNIQPLGVKS